MKYTVYDRLLKREVGQHRKKYSDIRSIYGDRQWVQDLDIVNELEGHNGCVNALCWSRSGRLLASGSDDHRINIHCYHPESSTSQFSLTTSIMTGHHLNIFSVKFMPYSNDRTIVSATDDVRIFDIEYSGHSALDSGNRSQARRRRVGIQGAPDGLTLTEGDTNAKAFRCHSDTVKRIVTEDNPFYFLTCSEDGDVRQWDIRQPSKTYPPPKDSLMPSWAANPSASDNIPPPLISYSRYGLDLNTVSCSPSQPHYIALGGAHLHCFLHDRRMLGRDKNRERGGVLSSPGPWGELDNELLGKATQCVKKFAPRGQKRMKRNDSGHITACKISDYNPNELIVSWSSDYIYSFDINRSPDASEEIVSSNVSKGNSGRRVKDKSRKRKRPKSRRVSQEAAERAGSRQRTASSDEGLALRVTYGNGQSEEIRIEPPQTPLSQTEVAALQETDHYRIARTAVKIQRRMFDFGELGDTGLKLAYTSILGFAASILPEMDDISRTWRYPVDPNPVDVAVQNKLRDTRASCRRFVQAAGTLSRVLGGQLLTGGTSDALIAQYFVSIQFAPSERSLPRHEQFGYDFLKAILLWLDSGPGAVVEGFTSRSSNPRLPLAPDADIGSIDEALIPYLLQLAGDDPIVNVDVSRFETDDTRILYSSEKAAVIAFSRAIRVPFADLTGAIVPTTGDRSTQYEVQDRREAIRVWASRIGRGVLLNASKDVRFSIVDRAFGGRGVADPSARAEEDAFRERQDDIDPLEEDQPVVAAEVISGASGSQASEDADEATSLLTSGEASQRRSGASGVEAAEDDDEEEQNDGENDDDSDGDIDSSEEENDSDDEEGGLQRTRSGRMLWRSEFGRSRQRERVELDVPCAPHTRVYTGHCNVRTVKDVNYFGLQDEYVVSGSDSGHVFIWDRKSAQLLNILEGDGEVVNVVQGHPYEPTMAVSGIDHTIKIFSPDAQEQRNARKGIGVQTADPGRSSLGYGRRRRAQRAAEPEQPRDPTFSDSDEEIAPNGLRSRRRMHQQYQITSQNDMNRKGAGDDFFISRAVFAQLARLHAQHHAGNGTGGDGDGDGDDDEEGDGPIVITEENCSVM